MANESGKQSANDVNSTQSLPSVRNTAQQFASRKKKFPRGITVTKREDRGGRWLVMWNDRESGKRKRPSKLFPTKEAAEIFAGELAGKVREHGTALFSFDPREWQRYLELRAAFDGADLQEVVSVWREHLQRRRKSNIATGAAVAEFVEIITGEGARGDYLSHIRVHLQRFARFVGEETPLGEVSVELVRDWLVMLGDDDEEGEGDGFSPVTVRNHLKHLRTFFSRATAERWTEENPADKSRVKGPRVVAGEKLALSIEEAKRLFAVNRGERVAGRLALEAFGGVRYTGAIRLTREDVNWKDRLIVLPAELHKSGARHVLDDLPDNLWAWLKHADSLPKFWEMTQRQYLEEKTEAFARAGIENPGNVLRRSFCSWMVALNGDAKRVAAWMQHRSPDMLYRQYKSSKTRTGFVTKQAAEAWVKILPAG